MAWGPFFRGYAVGQLSFKRDMSVYNFLSESLRDDPEKESPKKKKNQSHKQAAKIHIDNRF